MTNHVSLSVSYSVPLSSVFVFPVSLSVCSVSVCLQKNIVHRDLKLGNMVLNKR